jgi:hypothetical protein
MALHGWPSLSLHAPEPEPSQLFTPVHAGTPFASSSYFGVLAHVPTLNGALHDLHCPVHAALQHTPSTHLLPSAHAASTMHDCPSFTFGTHSLFAAQYEDSAQSSDVAHDVPQAEVPAKVTHL